MGKVRLEKALGQKLHFPIGMPFHQLKLGLTPYHGRKYGDRKVTGDEQPVSAHLLNWFGISRICAAH